MMLPSLLATAVPDRRRCGLYAAYTGAVADRFRETSRTSPNGCLGHPITLAGALGVGSVAMGVRPGAIHNALRARSEDDRNRQLPNVEPDRRGLRIETT